MAGINRHCSHVGIVVAAVLLHACLVSARVGFFGFLSGESSASEPSMALQGSFLHTSERRLSKSAYLKTTSCRGLGRRARKRCLRRLLRRCRRLRGRARKACIRSVRGGRSGSRPSCRRLKGILRAKCFKLSKTCRRLRGRSRRSCVRNLRRLQSGRGIGSGGHPIRRPRPVTVPAPRRPSVPRTLPVSEPPRDRPMAPVSTGGSLTPATCNCQRDPPGAGVCYFYRSAGYSYCARRPCARSYSCSASGTGIRCVRRKTTVKIIPINGRECKTERVIGFMYVPYITRKY